MGGRAWWLTKAHETADAGDYLAEVTREQHDALARFGVAVQSWTAGVPAHAPPLARPAVRLFAGDASKFPYFAYYALCLLRLGIDYVACDGDDLSQGTLDEANLLILPGGFATWGIDAAERTAGADARVRAFLANGGAAIGSCGGAFYLSAGRPGWTGTVNAKPLYTHEYLQSGVGVVTLALREGPLALGLPPTIEVPYYHGPIYDLVGDDIDIAATFHAFALPGRLAIDNPLDRERFEREMKGKPAIVMAKGARGRAVLFSPHPEMGDLVRKYIALDGYVRHYLPIRGARTMHETLRHYRVTDAPCFRLVVNAVDALLCEAPRDGVGQERANHESAALDFTLLDAGERALAALPAFASGDEGALLRDIAATIATRLSAVRPRFAVLEREVATLQRLMPAWQHLSHAVAGHALGADATAAQHLMEAELVVSLIECWTRAAKMDRTLAA
jgi:hypothetical protein